jgi:hypothetical protein
MLAGQHGASDISQAKIAAANAVAEVFAYANLPLVDAVARDAWQIAAQVLHPALIEHAIVLFDHGGVLVGNIGMAGVGGDHSPPGERKRR